MAGLREINSIEGERWDALAYRAYGDEMRIEPLIVANPGIPLNGRIPGGLKIYIPILSKEDDTVIPNELMPPWKRDV